MCTCVRVCVCVRAHAHTSVNAYHTQVESSEPNFFNHMIIM